MFIFCLFALTLAQKAIILDVTEVEDGFTSLNYPNVGVYDMRTAMYLKHEVGKCLYLSPGASVKYEYKDNKVYVSNYANPNCSGNTTAPTAEKAEWKDKYKDAPAQKGSRTEDTDDDKCSHEASMSKYYYKDGCNKVQLSVSGSQSDKYIKFFGEDGKFFFRTYDDAKCDTESKFKDGTAKNLVFECDKCKDKYKYQCGSVATMILAVFAILAFFF